MIGSAADIAQQIARGTRSAAAVLAECKALIEARDPDLNCFTAKTFERAEREAAAIDGLYAEGKPLPPLAGVPYAVKNLFDVEGMVTLAGAKINAGNAPAAADATIVARMSRAGAVLVGALNMEELAYGFLTENHHYGTTRNPHDRTRGAGGSSGGSAAAVGAGMLPITLGSDTSGSIRVPASLCGVFGLKPTYGRLPRSGTYPFVNSFDHVGPFANSVLGLALAYDAMQGPDAADPACAQRAIEPAGASLSLPRGIRIGILGGWFHEWADPAARRSVQLAAAALGATEWAELKSAEVARAAAYVITGAEGGALHRPRLIEQYADFGPSSRSRLVAGGLIPASWVIQAQRVRQHAYREAMDLFERFRPVDCGGRPGGRAACRPGNTADQRPQHSHQGGTRCAHPAYFLHRPAGMHRPCLARRGRFTGGAGPARGCAAHRRALARGFVPCRRPHARAGGYRRSSTAGLGR